MRAMGWGSRGGGVHLDLAGAVGREGTASLVERYGNVLEM